MSCVKVLSESTDFNPIPSNYVFFKNTTDDTGSDSFDDSIPVIDYSLLAFGAPDQRIKVVEDLGKACEEWGVFMVVNHGIPASLMKALTEAVNEFFNLPEEEKLQYEKKHFLDPIMYGTSFNPKKDQVLLWRDYMKLIVHPKFHCPPKPETLSDIVSEYCERARELLRKLLQGVSQSLGLEEDYIEKSVDLDSGLSIFAANYYPPCPQPELAIGLPPHRDHGLLTFLIQNDVGGLQIHHNGKWINVNPLPNSILVNTGDHLEILSNGKYKSLLHRAILNNQKTRISLPIANGPSLETIVRPAAALLEREGCVPTYTPITYRAFLERQQGGKAHVDPLKIQNK